MLPHLHLIGLLLAGAVCPALAEDAPDPQEKSISFYKDIRPIFQAKCQGCHQPAKAKGGLVMTSFKSLMAGGESEKAIVPGKPEERLLFEMITPVDGEAEMPRKQRPLQEHEIEHIGRWIAQGAVDDTPENARQRFDMENPPLYTRPPVITSIDYSPDGHLLAVAGFHEVLLWQGVLARR